MSAALKTTLETLLAGEDLDERHAVELLRALTDTESPPALVAGILVALRAKGVTATEIRGFANAMRGLARRPMLGSVAGLTDVVGTGGDGSGSLNLSTGTALLAAACGVPIVKHGNRSVSSRSGSADVLEALGLPLPLDENAAGRCLEQTGFTFLFAPYYHPAMKSVAAVRGALGVRTVFNILGPLINPAAPAFHLLGAYSPQVAELMADALAGADIDRAFVIHGEPGWDEATPVGPFLLFDVRPGQVERHTRDPLDWGVARCRPEDLQGGDAEHNAQCLEAVFAGQDTGPHRDALVLGAALVLELTGRSEDGAEAVARVADVLDSGQGRQLLEALRGFGGSESG